MTYSHTFASTAAAITLCLSVPGGAVAQASGDGRVGPRVFTDAVLNESLAALNGFLSDRYAHDDMMAALSAPPAKDFEATAIAVADVPYYRDDSGVSGFTGSINSGSALDLHLAAFNDERQGKGDSLFVQVARAAGGTSLDMREAGGLPPVAGDVLSFGPSVDGDRALEVNLDVLSEQMVDRAVRDNQLSGDGAVTGHSFDLYSEALRVF